MTVNQLDKDDGMLTNNDQETADVLGDFLSQCLWMKIGPPSQISIRDECMIDVPWYTKNPPQQGNGARWNAPMGAERM